MRYEQVVYGSFPFWDKGYAVLAHSPGCLPEWRHAFEAACQKFGERPRGATDPFPGAMFTVNGLSGQNVWAVVGVSTPGTDDHGRPDALVFHGLVVPDRDFRAIGYDPFALVPCLRSDWSPESTTLDAGECEPDSRSHEVTPEASRIASVLKGGKRVALESSGPVDGLARSVWAALPESRRKKLTVATWAYANALHFDLLAAPRLASLELDSSYVDPSFDSRVPPVVPDQGFDRARTHGSGTTPGPRKPFALVKPVLLVIAAISLAGVSIATVRGLQGKDAEPVAALTAVAKAPPSLPDKPPVATSLAPDRITYPDAFEDPAEAHAVEQGLAAIGNRFLGFDPDTNRGPTAWMQLIAAFRYEGRLLTDDELAAISASTAPGRSRALADHARVHLFVDDRPLPEGFASGPLRWQLDTLAWSFHLELDPKLTAAEVPSTIAEALALDEPVSPNPLEAQYPALADYAAFLGRLPRRP